MSIVTLEYWVYFLANKFCAYSELLLFVMSPDPLLCVEYENETTTYKVHDLVYSQLSEYKIKP